MLRRSPLFAAVSILALSVGIGANTAIFSLMDAVLLRALPGLARPNELVTFERWQAGQLLGDMGYPDYLDYREQLKSFSGVVAEASTRLSFAEGPLVERVASELVSGNYFDVLGVKPAAGRLIAEEDDREGRSEPVAVLSHAFWQRAFGGDSHVAGKTIHLNGHSFTVAGVAAREFRGTQPQAQTDLWLAISLEPIAMPRMSPDTLRNRANGWLRIFGRLKPQVSLRAAQAEVNTVAARLAQAYPVTNHVRTVTLVEGVGLWSDDRAELRRFLELLLLCVGLLQLIACGNVANLLLARGAARQKEIAVRLALGATRGRVLRLLFAEGMLLFLFAGILSVFLAPTATQLAVSVPQPAYAMRNADVHLSVSVLTFALLVTMLSAFLFASASAWKASLVDVVTWLKEGARGGSGTKSRLRGILVAGQIALSIALLASAGTVIGSMRRALAANPILRPEDVVLCSFDLSIQGYSAEKGQGFYGALLQRVRAMPGVTSASLAFTIPPEEWPGRRAIFYPGQEPPPEVLQGREFELGIRVDTDTITGGFFRTLGIPLLKGRDFEERDRAESPRVAIINEKLAQRLWPGKDPIGQRISVPEWDGPQRPPVEVIGMVKDVAARSLLSEAPMQLYLPYSQEYGGRATLVVRSGLGPTRAASALRGAVAGLDPLLPLYAFQTMPEHVAASLWRQRIAVGLLGAFGLVAVALASLGLYGVVAHSVSQRTREIGIRMAIGARAEQIYALVIRQGMNSVLAGAVAGLPISVLSTVAMQKSIPGTKPHDPWALGASLLLLGGVSLLASYFPARRAAKVDPVVALRYE